MVTFTDLYDPLETENGPNDFSLPYKLKSQKPPSQ